MLTGVDVHRLEIQNLVFRDGNVTGDGGALDISGLSTLGLRNSSFFNNHATGKGGAVHFAPDSGTDKPTIGAIGVSGTVFGSETNAAEGNTATTGGGLSIESPGTGNNNSGINGSTFANNTATGNGGGFAYAIPPATAENLSLNGNVVVKNKAGGSGGGAHVLVANTFLGDRQRALREQLGRAGDRVIPRVTTSAAACLSGAASRIFVTTSSEATP